MSAIAVTRQDQERPFRRRLVMNTAMTGVGNVWSIIVSAIALPLTLHGLGTDAFGLWVLVQTFSAFTGWFALVDLGIGTAATRFLAARAALGDEKGTVSCAMTAMASFVVAGSVALLGFAVAGRMLLPGMFGLSQADRAMFRTAILVFAVQLFVDVVTRGAECCLEGLTRVDLARGIELGRRTLTVGSVAAVALAGGDLVAVAAVSLLASIPACVVAQYLLYRCLPRRAARPNRSDLATLFVYGREIALLRPIGVVHRMMDRVIVGATLGPAAVALVEIATQVQVGADAILSASSYSVTPSASWLDARGDSERLAELFVKGTRLALLATAPFIVMPALLAPELVRVWLGADQSAASGLIVVALAYVLVTAPVQVGSNLLLGVGRARSVLWPALAGVIVNLAVSLLLVQHVGIVGVFIGSLIAAPFVVVPILRASLVRVQVPKREFLRHGVRPVIGPVVILAATVGVVAVVPLADMTTLFVAAALGALVYACSAFSLALDHDERVAVRAAVRRARGQKRQSPSTARCRRDQQSGQ
jgi:O-antigen/teichoic acid export membrane protein